MAAFSRAAAEQIAGELACDPNFVLAVADVESGGRSDLPDGRPLILFEAHWFSNFTNHQYDGSHPRISSNGWNKALYLGGAAEYDRLAEADTLDHVAAYKSASWGLFQIMGFNFARCGFPDVDAFVNFVKGPNDNDMTAFVRFVKADNNMLQAMRNKDSRTFARLYNGPGQVDHYAAKIDAALAAHAGGGAGHAVNDIAAIQAKLAAAGFDPGPVDGVWGQKTHDALLAFQLTRGLTVDGVVGPMTRKALGLA